MFSKLLHNILWRIEIFARFFTVKLNKYCIVLYCLYSHFAFDSSFFNKNIALWIDFPFIFVKRKSKSLRNKDIALDKKGIFFCLLIIQIVCRTKQSHLNFRLRFYHGDKKI